MYIMNKTVFFIISLLLCCCSNVRNEPVRVIQTDSFSDAFVIQVNKFGTYYVYIANESDRYQYAQLLNQKATIGDSIWKVKLSDIDKCIAIYKKATKDMNIKIKIEVDRNAEYLPIKNLMRCLQDTGYTRYNLTTKP